MATALCIDFPPFRLDLVNEHLWRGDVLLPVRPKPFALLRYLAEHADRLVAKEELNKAVWPDTRVGESSLKGYIRDLRELLEDDPESPQFIETVARRGYRFIAKVQQIFPVPDAEASSSVFARDKQLFLPVGFVGRERELAYLQERWRNSCQGKRQVVFVTGEPGIGKSTLIDVFLHQLAATGGIWVERGQCVEHHGAGEAYLPILEALGRSCRRADGTRVLTVLRQYAPTWVVQLPALLSDAAFEMLQRKAQGATRERMLREMAEALETLATTTPVVLAVEDLQWSDHSTLDLLSYLAQRREPARILVIGTYRPTDVIVSGHPVKALKQELQSRRRCEELVLNFLSQEHVDQYLAVRFSQHCFPQELSTVLYRNSEGNPLFLLNIVDHLVARALVQEMEGQWTLTVPLAVISQEMPETLRQGIEQQIERLTYRQQQMLEVASVIGAKFSAETVAVCVKDNIESVEECCETLVQRRQFLHTDETALQADEIISGRYSFRHALYQHVLYQRVPIPRRVRLHRLIGEHLENRERSIAGEIAAELMVHFERGHHYPKAVQYARQAAENALRRSAHYEAVNLLQRGVTLLSKLPLTPERIEKELDFHRLLIVSLTVIHGYAASSVQQITVRTRELCDQLGQPFHLIPVLGALLRFHVVRAEYEKAREVGERLLNFTHRAEEPLFRTEAHLWLGMIALNCGQSLKAQQHLECSVALCRSQSHDGAMVFHGQHLGVSSLCLLAIVLWRLGYHDQARKRSSEALTISHTLAHPYSIVFALYHAILLSLFYRDTQKASQELNEFLEMAHFHGFSMMIAGATVFQGLVQVQQGAVGEGIECLRQGITSYRATGAEIALTCWLGFLAKGLGENGQVQEGLTVISEALEISKRTNEQAWDAELYRLRGRLLLKQEDLQGVVQTTGKRTREAEHCFQQALTIARHQCAKSLELRVAVTLGRLWQRQGKKHPARELLSDVYKWFTEGFDTQDLREAKALLRELS